jgi:hypothetical protein
MTDDFSGIDQFLVLDARGQEVLISWHPPELPGPIGTPHGSAGLCFTPDGKLILISLDGERWNLPAGRPEGDEDWRETLDREMLEEACARVEGAVLLGFARGECVKGPELGLVLIRSVWAANVELYDWKPQYEIPHRLVVEPEDAIHRVALISVWTPIIERIFQEACRVRGEVSIKL